MIEGRVYADGCGQQVVNAGTADCVSGQIQISVCSGGGNPTDNCSTSHGHCITHSGVDVNYTEANTFYDIIDCAPPKCSGCGSCEGCRPAGCQSPIVIDLLNEGMHFTSLSKGVKFDFNADGKPLFMSWTDPKYHNAWLALDRDKNGTIDNAQELFGYPTEPQLPSRGQRNGWLALAVYDQPSSGGNADGVIDVNDAIYSSLLLWIDDNHDGISQPSELHHLAEIGVQKIPLKYGQDSYTDQYGNTFSFETFVAMPRRERRQAWDVVLDASETPPGKDVVLRSHEEAAKRRKVNPILG